MKAMFYKEFNRTIYKFEENLNFLKQTGEIDKIKEDFFNTIDFIENNVFEPVEKESDEEKNEVKLRKEFLKKNLEASKYLDKIFLDTFYRFKREMYRDDPDIENVIKHGIGILQRLRAFTKISSSSSY